MFLKFFTFNTPYGFLLFPILFGCLLYIYLKFHSNRKIIFPSFFLLNDIKEKKEQGKKLKIPLRFFYELLILFIFTLIFMNISFKNYNEKYLFFIDNSFSTKLKTSGNTTSFDLLKNLAKDTLGSLPSNSLIKIQSSDFNFQSKYLKDFEATNFIETLKNSYSNDNLENIAFDTETFKKIFIFTDKHINEGTNDNIFISTIQKDKDLCNFSISKLNIISDSVHYEVSSYCEKESQLNIKITCDNGFNSLKKISLLPQNNLIDVQKISKLSGETACNITISSPLDNLEEDNEAFFILNKSSKKKIYLVSNPKIDISTLISLPFKIKDISENEIEKLNKNDIIVFNNVPLKSLPQNPSLIITPPVDSYFYQNTLNKSSIITSFEEGSSLITYINPVNLIFHSPIGLNIDNKYYSQNILKIDDDPLLSIIENNNRKYILSGFSLLPFKESNLNTKIIFLNSIKFLSKDNFFEAYKNIPFSYKEKNEEKTILIPSFYTIKNQKQAFNFFDTNESNILESRPINLRVNLNIQKKDIKNANFLNNILTKILLSLILIELFFLLLKKGNK